MLWDVKRNLLKFFSCFLFVVILNCLYIVEAQALGQLTVAPTRIVFDAGSRNAKVTLVNTGNEAITYRIAWTRKRMTESGGYEEVDEPLAGEKFSDSMIRFSPRQVLLPPGKPQVVRLLLRKPASLEQGEYRSYLRFSAIPTLDHDGSAAQVSAEAQGISIKLTPIMAVSIPVIVRQGQLAVESGLGDLALRTDPSVKAPYLLDMTMQRSGERSVYGDFVVNYISPKGKSHVVGLANGIAAYPPNSLRRVELPLYPPEGIKLERGRLQVLYRQQPDEGGETLAEAELTLP